MYVHVSGHKAVDVNDNESHNGCSIWWVWQNIIHTNHMPDINFDVMLQTKYSKILRMQNDIIFGTQHVNPAADILKQLRKRNFTTSHVN